MNNRIKSNNMVKTKQNYFAPDTMVQMLDLSGMLCVSGDSPLYGKDNGAGSEWEQNSGNIYDL